MKVIMLILGVFAMLPIGLRGTPVSDGSESNQSEEKFAKGMQVEKILPFPSERGATLPVSPALQKRFLGQLQRDSHDATKK